MAYADILPKLGAGQHIRIDISADNFSTISYRWATCGGLLDGTNEYHACIASFGSMTRGFGQGGIAASGAVSVKIANTDEVADWLLDISTSGFATYMKAKFRVYSVIHEAATPGTFASKQLGDFFISEPPERTRGEVRFQLSDAILGPLSAAISLPTLGDWRTNAGETEDTCPLFDTGYPWLPPEGVSDSTQIPLVFGDEWVRAMPLGVLPTMLTTTSTFKDTTCMPVCVRKSDATTPAVRRLIMVLPNGSRLEVPDEYDLTGGGGTQDVIWFDGESNSITKNGASWTILYVAINIDKLRRWLLQQDPLHVLAGSAAGSVEAAENVWLRRDDPTAFERNCAFYCYGDPWSQVTVTTSNQVHGADVITDLISYYTTGLSSSDLNTTALARVKAATPANRVTGVIGGFWPEQNVWSGNTMREVLTGICASCDFDIFVDWNGDVSLSCELYDYTQAVAVGAANFVSVSEESLRDMRDWIPGEGERGAVFNRAMIRGGRPQYAFGTFDPPSPGPYDDATTITSWGRPVAVEFDVSWLTQALARADPLQFRNIRNIPKTRARFTVDMAVGLQLDLGDLFYLTWNRNQSGSDNPYTDTVFKVESISFSHDSGSVEIEALWNDNAVTEKSYLLDNETLLVKSTGSGGRTATVQNSVATVTFSSGNLTTDGVAAGDVFVLLDTTQADDVFTRCRAIKIASKDSTTQITLTGDLAFGTASPLAVSSWEIRRSYLTYHTVGTDPTNYPDGSTMYGKASSTSDTYSDASAANLLTNG